MIELIHDDCLNVMKKYNDHHFDLAIVDPPYGIYQDAYRENHGRTKLAPTKKYNNILWDQQRPNIEYFSELKRISKNQIIFGANHLSDLFNASSPCWIVWDKKNEKSNFSDCELAYTSFNSGIKKFSYMWNGMLQENMKNKEIRIHPTQKPVKLYEWILVNYAKKGKKILDTHLGSGSIAIACHYFGADLVGIEINKEYYKGAKKRIDELTRQESLF